jgi:hypothetical protein
VATSLVRAEPRWPPHATGHPPESMNGKVGALARAPWRPAAPLPWDSARSIWASRTASPVPCSRERLRWPTKKAGCKVSDASRACSRPKKRP